MFAIHNTKNWLYSTSTERCLDLTCFRYYTVLSHYKAAQTNRQIQRQYYSSLM